MHGVLVLGIVPQSVGVWETSRWRPGVRGEPWTQDSQECGAGSPGPFKHVCQRCLQGADIHALAGKGNVKEDYGMVFTAK